MAIRPVERAAYLVGALLLLSGFVHLASLVATGGSWTGPLSLRKPTVFGFSFGITLITIAWVTSFMRIGARMRAFVLGLFTAVCVMETFLVSLQAWRGVPSHFNSATAFDTVVSGGLAFGGAALVAIIGTLTVTSFRSGTIAPRTLRTAIRAGFVALCGSLAVGVLMIARGVALVAAGNPQAAYLTGGVYKPTHAVTMHGILMLPLLAWALSMTDWSEQRQLTTVRIACWLYFLVIGVVAIVNFGA